MQKTILRKFRRFRPYLVSEKVSNTKDFNRPLAVGYTANPDYKGTERQILGGKHGFHIDRYTANPDYKGTESGSG